MSRSLSCSLLVVTLAVGAGCGSRTSLGNPTGPARRDGAVDRALPGLDARDGWWRPEDRGWVSDDWALPDRAPPPDGGCVSMGGGTVMAGGNCCQDLVPIKTQTGATICSKPCTADDPATPLVNEDSCPDLTKYLCAPTLLLPGAPHACVRRCSPKYGSKACGPHLACHWRSVSYSPGLDQAVCVYPGCLSGKDCPVYLDQSCSPGAVGQCAGQAGVFCAADESSASGGTCAQTGSCEAASGLCLAFPGAGSGGVGAPCKTDLDCQSGRRCDRERTVGGQLHARNGYCVLEGCAFPKTLPERACPAGSVCQRLVPGGACFKACKLESATDCRGHAGDQRGDYECYALNNLAIGGGAIADAPTCEPADSYPCTLFATSKLDCTYLGTYPSNSTQMQCRERTTGTLLPKGAPGGFCLDTTSSGP